MHSLKTAVARVRISNNIALCVSPVSVALVRLCERIDGLVCDITAFDQTDPLEFWQRGQLRDRVVC